jgi:DNA-directed RNA polymerase
MKTFTGIEYLKLAMANSYGLDKQNWEPRLEWVDDFLSQRDPLNSKEMIKASEPLLLEKAYHAYTDAIGEVPVGFLCNMDATASGLQILACLTGCKVTARNVNLINTGNREDIYRKMATTMSKDIGKTLTRSELKDPTMTVFYGSKMEPIKLFGEGTTELHSFYLTLEKECPLPFEVIEDIQSCWQSDTLQHIFTLPDGHTASVPVTQMVKKKIEIDELEHTTFTYQTELNIPQSRGISLIANIVQAIDAYVVREMIRKAKNQGFDLLCIHDSFWAHCNYMNNVRNNYKEILSRIARSNLLQDILRQVTGDANLTYAKEVNDLPDLILEAEYALS